MRSKINVVFDEALVAFCGRVRAEFAEGIAYFSANYHDCGSQVRLQTEIRDYIVEHQAEFRLSWGALSQRSHYSHPGFFAIFMCITADLTQCTSCDDALQQTDYQECVSAITDIGDGGDEESVCVCGHDCSTANTYRITNKKTGLMSIVGQDCIRKHKLVDPKVFARAKKEARVAVKQKKITIARALELVLMKRMFNALKRRCPRCDVAIEHTEKRRYCKSEKRCNACLNRMYNKPFILLVK